MLRRLPDLRRLRSLRLLDEGEPMMERGLSRGAAFASLIMAAFWAVGGIVTGRGFPWIMAALMLSLAWAWSGAARSER